MSVTAPVVRNTAFLIAQKTRANYVKQRQKIHKMQIYFWQHLSSSGRNIENNFVPLKSSRSDRQRKKTLLTRTKRESIHYTAGFACPLELQYSFPLMMWTRVSDQSHSSHLTSNSNNLFVLYASMHDITWFHGTRIGVTYLFVANAHFGITRIGELIAWQIVR